MKVKAVIGEICSGKTTYSLFFEEQYKEEGKSLKTIDIGSVVRELTSTHERVFDESLDVAITNRLFQVITKALHDGYDEVMIVGIRQVSILNEVEKICEKRDIEVNIVFLDVPTHIREERYEARTAKKDTALVFDFADKKDKELGLFSLIQYIKHKKNTLIVKNY